MAAKKVDGRRNNGAKKGENRGAGRKPKTDEEKSMQIMILALKRFTGKRGEDEAKTAFIQKWLEDHPQAAMKFIAEHLMGKPTERKDIEVRTDAKVVPIITFVDDEEDEKGDE